METNRENIASNFQAEKCPLPLLSFAFAMFVAERALRVSYHKQEQRL